MRAIHLEPPGKSQLEAAAPSRPPACEWSGLGASRRRAAARTVLRLVAVLTGLGWSGCVQVPVWKQERVSKPNMVFNDRGVFVYGPRVNAQIEPGSADNGGATAAGCTACK